MNFEEYTIQKQFLNEKIVECKTKLQEYQLASSRIRFVEMELEDYNQALTDLEKNWET